MVGLVPNLVGRNDLECYGMQSYGIRGSHGGWPPRPKTEFQPFPDPDVEQSESSYILGR